MRAAALKEKKLDIDMEEQEESERRKLSLIACSLGVAAMLLCVVCVFIYFREMRRKNEFFVPSAVCA
jgi:hypothetical protein